MAKRGRPNKYLTNVRPRFNEISQWVEQGATDKEIADLLGVNKGVFCKYKKEYKELNELMTKKRQSNIRALKAALYKKAIGFQYEEIEEIRDGEGVRTRRIKKTCLPSETAILILLKHWDRNEDGSARWMNDPATFELKMKEYELKKESFENEGW